MAELKLVFFSKAGNDVAFKQPRRAAFICHNKIVIISAIS